MKHTNCTDKTCPNYGKYCRKHQAPVEKKPKPIKPMSKKRVAVSKQYVPNKDLFLQAHPNCQVRGCTNKSDQIHHLIGKDSVEDFLNEKEWLAVCFDCHRKIHDNHGWALQEGYIKSKHSNFKRTA